MPTPQERDDMQFVGGCCNKDKQLAEKSSIPLPPELQVKLSSLEQKAQALYFDQAADFLGSCTIPQEGKYTEGFTTAIALLRARANDLRG